MKNDNNETIHREIEFTRRTSNFDEWLEAAMHVGIALKDYQKQNEEITIVAMAAYISHETNAETGETEDKYCIAAELENGDVISSIAGAIYDMALPIINLIDKHGKVRCKITERKSSNGDWLALIPQRPAT